MCLQLWIICSIQCTVHLFLSFHFSTRTHTYSVHTFFSNWCKMKSATCSSSSCLCHQGAPGLRVAAIMLPPVPDLQLLLSLNHNSRVSENPYCHLTSLSEVLLDVCFKRWQNYFFSSLFCQGAEEPKLKWEHITTLISSLREFVRSTDRKLIATTLSKLKLELDFDSHGISQVQLVLFGFQDAVSCNFY